MSRVIGGQRPKRYSHQRTAANAPNPRGFPGAKDRSGLPRFLRESEGNRSNVSETGQPAAHASQAWAASAGDYEAERVGRAGDLPQISPAPIDSPLQDVSGRGLPTTRAAHGLTLHGRTDAKFDGGSFRTRNVRTNPAGDCEGCAGADCARVTGVLESTFRVTTTITLPRVEDFPDLTPCQRRRVQDAITNILAPHEQEHARAFRQYNGTVRTRFDLTLCRSEFDARIQELHESVERERRATAQAASDALDPFHFEVDMNCDDS